MNSNLRRRLSSYSPNEEISFSDMIYNIKDCFKWELKELPEAQNKYYDLFSMEAFKSLAIPPVIKALEDAFNASFASLDCT